MDILVASEIRMMVTETTSLKRKVAGTHQLKALAFKALKAVAFHPRRTFDEQNVVIALPFFLFFCQTKIQTTAKPPLLEHLLFRQRGTLFFVC